MTTLLSPKTDADAAFRERKRQAEAFKAEVEARGQDLASRATYVATISAKIAERQRILAALSEAQSERERILAAGERAAAEAPTAAERAMVEAASREPLEAADRKITLLERERDLLGIYATCKILNENLAVADVQEDDVDFLALAVLTKCIDRYKVFAFGFSHKSYVAPSEISLSELHARQKNGERISGFTLQEAEREVSKKAGVSKVFTDFLAKLEDDKRAIQQRRIAVLYAD